MNANSPPQKIEHKKEEPDSVVFWGDNPNVLFNTVYFFEFYPTQTMTFNQKLNALSRTIIILTIVSFLFTRSTSLLVISMITLASIFYLYKSQTEEPKKENFTIAQKVLNEKGIVIPKNIFQEPSAQNPFSNVLVTDIEDNPQRLPAPPSANSVIKDEVLIKAKQMISENNKSQPDIVDKLFNSVNEELSFEQSLRQFHSTANTTIPNDQEAFLDFCYGSMMGSSCKSGNLFACAKNTSKYTNY